MSRRRPPADLDPTTHTDGDPSKHRAKDCFFHPASSHYKPLEYFGVILDKENRRVAIYVDHLAGLAFPCPVCEALCSVYDHTKERIFRHLDVGQMATFIHILLPEIKCSEHGVKWIVSALEDEHSGMIHKFESLVIDLQKKWSSERSL